MIEQKISSEKQQTNSEALYAALATIARTIPKMGSDRPKIGRADLTYVRCEERDWVDGFWSGQLWLAYAVTNDDLFRAAAEAQLPYFADRLNFPERHDHDLGFLYSLSCVAAYKLTGNSQARDWAVAAARSLSTRFNPRGQFIKAWNDWFDDEPEFKKRKQGKIIIDSLENLGLLYWAHRTTGEDGFRDIAIAHAKTVARYIVRPDFSTYHSFDFDPATGQPLGGFTVQGHADESCWSRGHAWGIHGFALSYSYTGETLFRDNACGLADYALEHLPADMVPYYDYRLPPEVPHYRDSSAGAITASGLYLLADLLEKDGLPEKARLYRSAGWQMLEALIKNYTTVRFNQAEGLLLHGASHVSLGLADNMLPYGDYFYIEGLLRAGGNSRLFFW